MIGAYPILSGTKDLYLKFALWITEERVCEELQNRLSWNIFNSLSDTINLNLITYIYYNQ